MCELCNIKYGQEEVLIEDDVTTKSVSGEHNIGVSAGIRMNTNGCYYLYSRAISDNEYVAETNIHLDFCPGCGRELKHRLKINLG